MRGFYKEGKSFPQHSVLKHLVGKQVLVIYFPNRAIGETMFWAAGQNKQKREQSNLTMEKGFLCKKRSKS